MSYPTYQMEDRSHRWSELVPPHTALTFAAIWDPDEGMVTFSGGKLLDSDLADSSTLRDTPRDAYDGQSQVLTIDRFTAPFASTVLLSGGEEGRRTGATVRFARAALDDAQSVVDPYFRGVFRRQQLSQDEMSDDNISLDPINISRGYRTMGHKRQGAVIDWSHLRAVGRHIYSAAVAPFDGRRSSSSDSSVTDEGFFEEDPWTAGTLASAPVMINLNLVRTVWY